MAMIGRPNCVIEDWTQSLRLACEWTVQRAMIRSREHPFGPQFSFENGVGYDDWRGAFRGEYSAALKQWDVFGPLWHGGQGAKALTLAAEVLADAELLSDARYAADFLLRHQNTDHSDDDFGLIPGYEDGGFSNTSCTLESLAALFELTRTTGEKRYADAAVDALRWVHRKSFLPEEGLFRDDYDLKSRQFGRPTWAKTMPSPGRPLLDDGVFLQGYEYSGDASLKDVALRTADRLLADEDPAGNWKKYPPADPVSGVIHPRHAYWWGRPLWMVHRHTGDQRYLDGARRSAQWYVQAMRSDGGLFRDTYPDFKTPSFSQATSGIACAVILWHDLAVYTGDQQWDTAIRKAIRFCRSMQFVECLDVNLKGAILEKCHAPRGSDASPWYLRDVGTFFYIQALSLLMRDLPHLLKD